MNCKEVRDKLEKYVNGKTTINDREKISEHLSTCQECMNEMVKLEEKSVSPEKMNVIFNKASKRLRWKVISTVISTILIGFLSVYFIIPGVLKAIRSFQISTYTSALADIVQFTQPVTVGGYGNSFPSGKPYTMEFRVYSHTRTGLKAKNMAEEEVSMNVITGIVYSPEDIGVQFIHPLINPEEAYTNEYSRETARRILDNNGEDTVATIDISLNKIISLEKLGELLREYDVDVLWMAIESGAEETKPKNMTIGQQQVLQWGIPGKLFERDGKGAEFKPGSEKEYEEKVIKEMEWLNKNKNIFKPQRALFKYNGIDNSVGNRAEYVLKNGINIYGIRITGPTKELLRLQDSFDIRFEEVVDVEFWNWR